MSRLEKAVEVQGLTLEQFAIKAAQQIVTNWEGIPKKLECLKGVLSEQTLVVLEDQLRELCGGEDLYLTAQRALRANQEVSASALVAVPDHPIGGREAGRLLRVWPDPVEEAFPWGEALEDAGSADLDEFLLLPPGIGFWMWEGKASYDEAEVVQFVGSYRRASSKEVAQFFDSTL